MPQWRKLHTKSVESLDINDMPDDFTRLLWLLLPTQLCREGRGLDSAAWVRSRTFPLRDDVTIKAVQDALDWYAKRGMIERYEVDGRGYFYVPSWERHQGNTSKEAESIYPAPPTYSRPTPDLLPPNSGTDADADADAEENGAVAPAAQEPVTWQDWQREIEQASAVKAKNGVLMRMFERLYPGRKPPGWGYLGKMARQIPGEHGNMGFWLFKNAMDPPQGDVLAYCLKCASNKANGNGRASPRRDMTTDVQAVLDMAETIGRDKRPAFDDPFLARLVAGLDWYDVCMMPTGQSRAMVKDAWFRLQGQPVPAGEEYRPEQFDEDDT